MLDQLSGTGEGIQKASEFIFLIATAVLTMKYTGDLYLFYD